MASSAANVTHCRWRGGAWTLARRLTNCCERLRLFPVSAKQIAECAAGVSANRSGGLEPGEDPAAGTS